jgi:hypothetical protein
MFPQMEVGLASSFRRPDLYSTAKLLCVFFTCKAFGSLGDIVATAQRGSGLTDSNYSAVGPSRQRFSCYEALAPKRRRDR